MHAKLLFANGGRKLLRRFRITRRERLATGADTCADTCAGLDETIKYFWQTRSYEVHDYSANVLRRPSVTA
jgi:hypothetical protein